MKLLIFASLDNMGVRNLMNVKLKEKYVGSSAFVQKTKHEGAINQKI